MLRSLLAIVNADILSDGAWCTIGIDPTGYLSSSWGFAL